MKVLSEAVIKTLSGAAVYKRGLDYYNAGKVSGLVINNDLIKAQVIGNQTYQVELRHTAKIFEGVCNCPASDNFDFCKHCVATSLSYYYQTQSNQEVDDGPAADILAHHLSTLTKPQLADELYAVIKQDKQLHELWQLRAELATKRLEAKDVRKQITRALPFRPSGIWRFNEVADYFSRSEQRIRALCSAIHRLPAEQAFKLLLYAYERLEKTLETIDDSGGYRYSLLEILEKEIKRCFKSAELDSQQRINFCAALFTNEKYTYELVRHQAKLNDLLNEQEQQGLVKVLSDYWNALPPPDKDDFFKDTPFIRIEEFLITNAQLKQDAAEEIELLTKGAVTVARCLELIDRCLELNDIVEANKWLAYASQLEGLRVTDISAIEHAQVKIWLAEGDYDSASKAQWAVFLEDESLSSIRELVSNTVDTKTRNHWLEKCIAYLQGRLSEQAPTPRDLERCETLVALFLQENRQQDATDLAIRFKLKAGTLMAIVKNGPSLGTNELKLAERACNYLIAFGSHETNTRAIAFLSLLKKRFAKQQNAFKILINKIYQRPENKRKINFTKELKLEFGDLISANKT